MGMRDWLIIIVIVGIILILLDGYRRKRKDRIRVKLEKNIPAAGPGNDTAVELPNGGARVVSREEEGQDYDEVYDGTEESDQEDQIVPVLMDAVDLADKNVTEAPIHFEDEEGEENYSALDNSFEEEAAEVIDAAIPDLDDESVVGQDYDKLDEEFSSVRINDRKEQIDDDAVSIRNISDRERIEPTLGEIDSFAEAELEDKPSHVSETTQSESQGETSVNDQAELFAESPEDFIQNDEDHNEDVDDYLEPEEVIVINVMAKQGESFAGSDLLPIILQQDMQLGKMSIFHKHADSTGNGPVMFSMANMLKPGTFDAAQMEEFSTPGVSFFLQLPNAFGNMKSFEQMLNAADSIKESLNGDLKDEHRSVITRQTIEHCRQRVQDFELAQLSKK
ncbi:MAG: cell division protein ZipA [Gammaproteobacteria bacterium]|jgi:cell division protein ZipA|nr:cell division protein ZipA [Gammaproteobacteria bacterium]